MRRSGASGVNDGLNNTYPSGTDPNPARPEDNRLRNMRAYQARSDRRPHRRTRWRSRCCGAARAFATAGALRHASTETVTVFAGMARAVMDTQWGQGRLLRIASLTYPLRYLLSTHLLHDHRRSGICLMHLLPPRSGSIPGRRAITTPLTRSRRPSAACCPVPRPAMGRRIRDLAFVLPA